MKTESLLLVSALSLLPLTSMGTDATKAPNATTTPNTSLPSEKPKAGNSPPSPPVFGPIYTPAPPSAAKGTVGNGGNGGKGGAGSVGNSKAPKGPAEPGTALVQPDGSYSVTTATAPKSASQGRPTGDTANDLKAPAPPK